MLCTHRREGYLAWQKGSKFKLLCKKDGSIFNWDLQVLPPFECGPLFPHTICSFHYPPLHHKIPKICSMTGGDRHQLHTRGHIHVALYDGTRFLIAKVPMNFYGTLRGDTTWNCSSFVDIMATVFKVCKGKNHR